MSDNDGPPEPIEAARTEADGRQRSAGAGLGGGPSSDDSGIGTGTKVLLSSIAFLALLCAGWLVAVSIFGRAAQDTTAPPADPIVGRWDDGRGTIYEITRTGTNAYHGEAAANAGYVCAPVDLRLTGSANRYTGKGRFYRPCGTFIGDATVTIDLSADGLTARVNWTPPPSAGGCSNCAPLVWTRQGASAPAKNPA